MKIQAGSIADYDALACHHYRAGRPATATRVLVLVDDARPSAMARFLGKANDEWRVPNVEGPSRPVLKPQTLDPGPQPPSSIGHSPLGIGHSSMAAGVLVESMPTLNGRLRDQALGSRYGRQKNMAARAALLADELRCISRVVIDPRYRGAGWAVALVKEALRTATTIYTEALAAMGEVAPFFERAGMTAYRRPAHEHDLRLSAALARVGLSVGDLADIAWAWQRVAQLPPAENRWLLAELRRWHRRTAGRAADSSKEPKDHLRDARVRLFCTPVYYLYDKRRGGGMSGE
ncbi:MAG: hypothetical protein IT443_01710 [Phycisphaeraceae bacterium]|nr:hypothetical protein [Phycisphaeraceae bacterium]